jgi:hypothetical protein
MSLYLQALSVIEEINYDKVSQCGNKMPTDSVTGLHNVSGTVCTEGKAHNVILQYFMLVSRTLHFPLQHALDYAWQIM